jgi:hypothetical protein
MFSSARSCYSSGSYVSRVISLIKRSCLAVYVYVYVYVSHDMRGRPSQQPTCVERKERHDSGRGMGLRRGM